MSDGNSVIRNFYLGPSRSYVHFAPTEYHVGKPAAQNIDNEVDEEEEEEDEETKSCTDEIVVVEDDDEDKGIGLVNKIEAGKPAYPAWRAGLETEQAGAMPTMPSPPAELQQPLSVSSYDNGVPLFNQVRPPP